MQKFFSVFLVSLLVLLTSCGKNPTASDFSSLYQAHTNTKIENFEKLAKSLGYLDSFTTSGDMQASFDLPLIASGSISSAYQTKMHGYGLGRDAEMMLSNFQGRYETLLASGSISAKEIAFIKVASDWFLRFNTISGTNDIIDPQIQKILDTYNNTWLSSTQDELLATFSGASEEEQLSMRMSQAFWDLSLEDIRGYIEKYPFFTETAKVGTEGSREKFQVSLAQESIIAMMDAFAEKSTGKKLTDANRKNLTDTLAQIRLSGVMTFDRENPKYAKFEGTLEKATGSGEKIQIFSEEDGNRGTFRGTSSATSISFDAQKMGENNSTIRGDITQSGAKIMSLSGSTSIDAQGSRFLEALISLDAQGMSVTIHNEYKKNGEIAGNINAGIGSFSWKGKISKSGVEELHMQGATIGATLTLDLTGTTDGFVEGPLHIKNGENSLVDATVKLRTTAKNFDLVLQITSPEDPTIQSHAEFHLTNNRQDGAVSITKPKDAKPLKNLSDEIEKLLPPENETGTWDEDFSQDALSGETQTESMSGNRNQQ